jgi:hypothetical protein
MSQDTGGAPRDMTCQTHPRGRWMLKVVVRTLKTCMAEKHNLSMFFPYAIEHKITLDPTTVNNILERTWRIFLNHSRQPMLAGSFFDGRKTGPG